MHKDDEGPPQGEKSSQSLPVRKEPYSCLHEIWKLWSEHDRPMEQAVTCADVKSSM